MSNQLNLEQIKFLVRNRNADKLEEIQSNMKVLSKKSLSRLVYFLSGLDVYTGNDRELSEEEKKVGS